MPVRSSSSSVLKWPDQQTVELAARKWAMQVAETDRTILQIGYFGSYARGDWGVGSDLDIVVVIKDCEVPRERRGLHWNVESLPVPVDLQVYTKSEWDSIRSDSRFKQTLQKEAIWIHSQP